MARELLAQACSAGFLQRRPRQQAVQHLAFAARLVRSQHSRDAVPGDVRDEQNQSPAHGHLGVAKPGAGPLWIQRLRELVEQGRVHSLHLIHDDDAPATAVPKVLVQPLPQMQSIALHRLREA
eukprot:scaffold869_cov303-Pinguiococcus_pyrenoidosus.AAC.3